MRLLAYAFLVLALGLASLPSLQASQPGWNELQFTIDRSQRKLYVHRGSRLIRIHDVAVGMRAYATPLGSWAFHQVDINPDWTPPDSDWARRSSYTPPGHPDNPMGRVRMIFKRPYTIHGTDALESLGQAASHGSVRIANAVAIELAELLLKEGGSWHGRLWFQAMLANPRQMYEIPLEKRIPIRIVE